MGGTLAAREVHAALELGARGVGCWMGGKRLRNWGPAVLDGWGPAEFGWVARGFGAGGPMGGTRLWSWGPAEFGWVARGFGAGGLRSLGGWHAAQELGARGVWMGGMRLRSSCWGFAVVARGSASNSPRTFPELGAGAVRAGSPRSLARSWGTAFGWRFGCSGAGAPRFWLGLTRLRCSGRGPTEFGCVARSSGAGVARSFGAGPAELAHFGWVARGSGAGARTAGARRCYKPLFLSRRSSTARRRVDLIPSCPEREFGRQVCF